MATTEKVSTYCKTAPKRKLAETFEKGSEDVQFPPRINDETVQVMCSADRICPAGVEKQQVWHQNCLGRKT